MEENRIDAGKMGGSFFTFFACLLLFTLLKQGCAMLAYECRSDSDCQEAGQSCQQGVCKNIPQEPVPDGSSLCKGDEACPDDKFCRLGRCASPPCPWVVSTVAGSGPPGVADGGGVVDGGGLENGPAPQALFYNPYKAALAADGTLYVVDAYNHRIRKIDGQGQVTTLAGSGPTGHTKGDFKDGPAEQARFFLPTDVALGPQGELYVADRNNHRIRKIAYIKEGACGTESDYTGYCVSTFAGTGEKGYGDGPASKAKFFAPIDVEVDSSGQIFVLDALNRRLRKIDVQGQVTTLAGSGKDGFQDGPALQVPFNGWEIILAPQGVIYFTDTEQHTIRKIVQVKQGPCGKQKNYTGRCIVTIAGTGLAGTKDGAARKAQFNRPFGMARAPDGTLYLTELRQPNIRMLEPDGYVSTIAGTGKNGYKDGPARKAQFHLPHGVVVDPLGRLYIVDVANHRLRLLTPCGQGQVCLKKKCIPSQLTAYYPLGEDHDDHSGLGHHGQGANVQPATNRFGHKKGASFLNGTASVQVKDAPKLSGFSAFTLCTWLYPQQKKDAKEDTGYILSKDLQGDGDSLTDSYALIFSYPQRRLSIAVWSQKIHGSLSSSALPLSSWSHVCAVYDGAKLFLYLNGKEEAQKPFAGTINKTTVPLRLGTCTAPPRDNRCQKRSFYGKIDEVRLYRRALSPQELLQQYRRP